MLDFLAPMTVSIVLFGVVGSVIHHLLRSRRELRLAEMQVQARARVLERLGSSQEVLEFFRNGGGEQWMPAPAEAEAVPSRLLNSLQIGIVILFTGLGFWLTSGTVNDRDVAEGLGVLAAVASAAGLGFVVSSLVGFFAARRLGLFGSATSAAEIDRPAR